MPLDPQLYLRLYHMMVQVRAFELGLEREFKRGNVPGMLHTGLGQEAVQAAIAANLRPTDCFFPDHRCHGLLFLAGTLAGTEFHLRVCIAAPQTALWPE